MRKHNKNVFLILESLKNIPYSSLTKFYNFNFPHHNLTFILKSSKVVKNNEKEINIKKSGISIL